MNATDKPKITMDDGRRNPEYTRWYRVQNPDSVKKYNASAKAKKARSNWKKANPEKVKGINAKWRKENPDKMRESIQAWRKANPEKYKAIRKAGDARKYAKYRERELAKSAEWAKRNVEANRAKALRHYYKKKASKEAQPKP